MMNLIKCSLIEINNDNRAVICIGEGEDGRVTMTAPVDWVDYQTKLFGTISRNYDFSEAED